MVTLLPRYLRCSSASRLGLHSAFSLHPLPLPFPCRPSVHPPPSSPHASPFPPSASAFRGPSTASLAGNHNGSSGGGSGSETGPISDGSGDGGGDELSSSTDTSESGEDAALGRSLASEDAQPAGAAAGGRGSSGKGADSVTKAQITAEVEAVPFPLALCISRVLINVAPS